MGKEEEDKRIRKKRKVKKKRKKEEENRLCWHLEKKGKEKGEGIRRRKQAFLASGKKGNK